MRDERFSEPGYAYGTEPNEFLASVAGRIPMGRVLCLAEGEGRNAVHLAGLGSGCPGSEIPGRVRSWATSSAGRRGQ